MRHIIGLVQMYANFMQSARISSPRRGNTTAKLLAYAGMSLPRPVSIAGALS